MIPQPYLVAPPLHLDYLPGSSDLLVLAFSGVGDPHQPVPPPEGTMLASWDGINHVLFVRDASRSWMNAPGLVETLRTAVDALIEKIKPQRVVAFGNSMGGTAALIFAALARLDGVLAIAPQFSMKPEIVPEERRWRHFARTITEWPFPSVPDLSALKDVMLLHGGDPFEIIHARRFRVGSGTDHYILPDCGHAVARILKNKQILRPLMAQALTGNMPEARTVVEAAGGIRFADYWQQRRDARRERRNATAV